MRRARPTRLLPRLGLGVLLLGIAPLGACSGIDGLDAAGPALSAAEQDDVHAQVQKALDAGLYNVAWNQEVQAGGDRERLEGVALRALRDRSRHAAAMFDALREKHGGLTPAARTRVDTLVSEQTQQGQWLRAVEIELVTAEDAPGYERAWAIYRAAPANLGPGLLEAIQAAKQAHAESDD